MIIRAELVQLSHKVWIRLLYFKEDIANPNILIDQFFDVLIELRIVVVHADFKVHIRFIGG